MIKLKRIKKYLFLFGTCSFLSINLIAKTYTSEISVVNSDAYSINTEELESSSESKEIKIINQKINFLRKRLNDWGNDEIPKNDLQLIISLKKNLSDYGDPQGFCKFNNYPINRILEKNISEYMLEIVKPIYKRPLGQKLNQYGKTNIWIPTLEINNSIFAKEEIELLKKLKPVYGYIYGDNKDIYQGPISQDAALLANDLIKRVLLKFEGNNKINTIDKVSLISIKASNYYWPLGRTNDAIKEYQKGIKLLNYEKRNQINYSALAHLYGSIAYLYYDIGDYASMQDNLDNAFKNLSELKILDVQALIETSLISYYSQLHNKNIDFNLLYKKYIEYLEIIGGSNSSSYLWAISDYLYYLDELAINKRIEISKKIVNGMRKCSKGYDLAWILRQKSSFEYQNKDYISALKTAEESLSEFVFGNGWKNGETLNTLGLIADIKISLGNYDEAIEIINKKINILRELGFTNLYNPTDDSPIKKLYQICSVIKNDKCDDNSAYKYLKYLIDFLTKKFIYLSNEDRGDLFNSIKNDIIYSSYNNSDLIEQQASIWLTTKGILTDIEKSINTSLNTNVDNKNAINQIKDISRRLSNINLEKPLRLNLLEQKNSLERDLYKKVPEINKEIISVNDIRSILDKKSALIEFQKFVEYDITDNDFELEEKYLAFLITKNNRVLKYDLGKAELIDQIIKSALISSEQGLKDAEDKWTKVRDLIIKPLENDISKYSNLFISPDGDLNNIPFKALSRKGIFTKKYLGSEFNINLLSTGRDLINLSEPLSKKGNFSLVVSNPSYDLQNMKGEVNLLDEIKKTEFKLKNKQINNKWSPIKNSQKEGRVISKLLNAKLITKNKANADNIKNFKDPKILHIASHYNYKSNEINKLQSLNPFFNIRIPLAGANNLIQDEKNNGYLSALEISGMDLNNTELVVISACESAIGDNSLGGQNFGLKRAITLSGARSSLLSLWKVDDEITSEFMIGFYNNLVSGMSRTKALLATQEEFRKSSNPYYRHIGAWGAFQLSGDWRKIDL
tara:strand:+ start:339 stop:3407 length:3069 start_codon:yes stop_codon:yes gene_type:complete